MKIEIKKFNFNYLVITGAVIFCCTLLLYIIISVFFENEINELSRFNIINNYFQFVFIALIVAPIIEELFFRGYFINNIFLKIIALIGTTFYIYITDNHYLYVLLLIFIIFAILVKFKKINVIYIFFINSLIFSLVHYKLKDFNSVFTIIPMFFQFSLGLVLIWIVLNFNLLRSILFHFLFNFLFILILTIPLQFPDKAINKIEYLGYNLEWSKIPIFNINNSIINRPDSFAVIAENVDIIKFCESFETSSNKIQIKDDHMFSKFNIKIVRSDSTANKLDFKTIENLLAKADLIEK